MIFDVPLRAWSLLQVGTAGHLHLFPAPEQKQNLVTVRTHNESGLEEEVKSEQRRLVLPLRESLARGVKHTTGGSVQKADFAAQHLHQVTLPTSTHLHLPQVIGVTCAILRTSKRWRCVLNLGTFKYVMTCNQRLNRETVWHLQNAVKNSLKCSSMFWAYSLCHSL